MSNSAKAYSANRKNEAFYKKAKEQNVRARSYFKLEQIDLKFNIIQENLTILDLGSAPGAWIEYIDSKIENGKIIGIDLLEIKKQNEFSSKVSIIEDDFENLEDYTNENFDLIISDMAPEFSGDSRLDRGKTHKLNFKTLELCKKHLKKNGTLVFKSFEGEDLDNVRKKAKELFYEVKEYKPHSSQKKSSEVFEICFRKK